MLQESFKVSLEFVSNIFKRCDGEAGGGNHFSFVEKTRFLISYNLYFLTGLQTGTDSPSQKLCKLLQLFETIPFQRKHHLYNKIVLACCVWFCLLHAAFTTSAAVSLVQNRFLLMNVYLK